MIRYVCEGCGKETENPMSAVGLMHACSVECYAVVKKMNSEWIVGLKNLQKYIGVLGGHIDLRIRTAGFPEAAGLVRYKKQQAKYWIKSEVDWWMQTHRGKTKFKSDAPQQQREYWA